jgi:hypothetical protein
MEYKNITQLRIHFKKLIHINSSSYELKVREKFRNNPKEIDNCLKKMKINLNNYLFYSSLYWKRYRDAINLYNSVIKDTKVYNNDVMRIMLLFFPHFLKSNDMEDEINSNNVYFNPIDLNFDDKSQLELNSTIKSFFINYKELKENKNFEFHRQEMFSYLDSFLDLYTVNENNEIKEIEKKEFMLLHYFRPFIRPEEFFFMQKEEKEITKTL